MDELIDGIELIIEFLKYEQGMTDVQIKDYLEQRSQFESLQSQDLQATGICFIIKSNSISYQSTRILDTIMKIKFNSVNNLPNVIPLAFFVGNMLNIERGGINMGLIKRLLGFNKLAKVRCGACRRETVHTIINTEHNQTWTCNKCGLCAIYALGTD